MGSLRGLRGIAALCVAALLAGLSVSCGALVRSPHAATPQRPSVSSSTTTTAAGTAEVELGVAIDPDESLVLPATLKVGLGPRTEAFLSWAPYVVLEQPGDDESGSSDVVLGGRHRLHEHEHWASALQLSVKIPLDDEPDAFTSGELDGAVAAIVDTAGPVPLTGFYELALLGEVGGGGADVRHTFALAASRDLFAGLSGFAELSLTEIVEASADEQ